MARNRRAAARAENRAALTGCRTPDQHAPRRRKCDGSVEGWIQGPWATSAATGPAGLVPENVLDPARPALPLQCGCRCCVFFFRHSQNKHDIRPPVVSLPLVVAWFTRGASCSQSVE